MLTEPTTAETPQPSTEPAQSSAAETAPQAPAEPPSAAELMESIIAEHAKEADEPQQPQQPKEQQPQDQRQQQAQQQQPAPAITMEAHTEIESAVADLLESDPATAYSLGAALMNFAPDLLRHNQDFILDALGLGEAEQQRAVEERARLDFQNGRAISRQTSQLFDEYVAKGKAAGLNDLEAVGLAALTYKEFETGFWSEGNSEWREAFNAWHGEIAAGRKLGKGRDAFRKAFDGAYRKTVEANKGHKPRAAQERTERPAPIYRGRVGDAEDVMKDIMRQHGLKVDD